MMRRALVAEGLGSTLLASTVIGSGIMAERLAGGNLAVALLANTAATVAVLATLIALLGPISGAHFKWIGAAYWFTASTSFANPAITIGRALSNTFAGIAPSNAPAFMASQLCGALVGLLLGRWLLN
jgi:glycerol uptake facilitator-like aquaporin